MSNSLSILIVVGNFYSDICKLLVDGAVSKLKQHDASTKFEIIEVPGALEVPAALSFSIMSDRELYDGYIALGCILKGHTSHNEHIARSVFSAISDIAVQHAVPVGTGIITADAVELALERADSNRLDVGGGAASAMLRMVELYRRFLG